MAWLQRIWTLRAVWNPITNRLDLRRFLEKSWQVLETRCKTNTETRCKILRKRDQHSGKYTLNGTITQWQPGSNYLLLPFCKRVNIKLNSSYLLRLFFLIFHSCCSHARVFGRTLVHEFPFTYSHTEWHLLFPRNDMIEMVGESPLKGWL